MKTIQEVKKAKAELEEEIALLIANFERENQVKISHIMSDSTITEFEDGNTCSKIVEVTIVVEL